MFPKVSLFSTEREGFYYPFSKMLIFFFKLLKLMFNYTKKNSVMNLKHTFDNIVLRKILTGKRIASLKRTGLVLKEFGVLFTMAFFFILVVFYTRSVLNDLAINPYKGTILIQFFLVNIIVVFYRFLCEFFGELKKIEIAAAFHEENKMRNRPFYGLIFNFIRDLNSTEMKLLNQIQGEVKKRYGYILEVCFNDQDSSNFLWNKK